MLNLGVTSCLISALKLLMAAPFRIRNLAVSGHELFKTWMRGLPPPTFLLPSPAPISPFTAPLRIRNELSMRGRPPFLRVSPALDNLANSSHELSMTPTLPSVVWPFQATNCPNHGCEACPPTAPLSPHQGTVTVSRLNLVCHIRQMIFGCIYLLLCF